MNKTNYIVPVANFFIESAFKLGDFIFSPSFEFLQNGYEEVSTDTLTEEEFNDIYIFIESIQKSHPHIAINSSFIIFQDEFIEVSSIEESFLLVNRLAEKANKSLDIFRINECQIGNYETLPGIAGISIDGFQTIFQRHPDSGEISILNGKVSFMIRDGIGLNPFLEPSLSIHSDPLYKCFFSDRTDIIYNTCRNALHRISEAMYMQNLNTAFIYLVSTLEMLASPDYIQFKKVKSKILPFISNSKSDYHERAKYLTDLSENKRTDIVHNGKNIFDLYSSFNEIKRELFKLTGIIVQYVENVIKLDLKNYEELEKKRNELISLLGV
jgi:hypothetical protein